MKQAETQPYRFNANDDPSDEQLDQLMENAAAKVRQSNLESDRKFFAKLNRACEQARKRSNAVHVLK